MARRNILYHCYFLNSEGNKKTHKSSTKNERLVINPTKTGEFNFYLSSGLSPLSGFGGGVSAGGVCVSVLD